MDSLEGAVYEITAAEDIITTDGTVRAEKGEVVDTLTTGEDGTAESKELYLGKYEVKEVTAPYGMVLSDEVHAVELVYAGQEIEVTETGTDFYNERQRVEIDLIKSLEIDEAYGVGNNGEIKDVTFGLYAAVELMMTNCSKSFVVLGKCYTDFLIIYFSRHKPAEILYRLFHMKSV